MKVEKFAIKEWAELISSPIFLQEKDNQIFNHIDLPLVKNELSITLRLRLQNPIFKWTSIFHKGTDFLIRTPKLELTPKTALHARFTGNWTNNAGIDEIGKLLVQKWYHIAYTLSEPKKRLDIYIDGEWVGFYSIQDVKSQNIMFNDGPLYIGQAIGLDGFNGEIRYDLLWN
ncbi:37578_t:CDS:2 [Gigaspora margarita]|uniref:37578_t:CDS:1 n=1 Tax=Gigaspora margarita TaxID=4874 RepID=A0ABM8W258_GIGMA|nr:37578_t:CDS:2 [Gigaspora margarita]